MNEKTAILVVSFGTTHTDTREKNLDFIENEIRERFSPIPVFKAYSSGIVRSVLRKRDNIDVSPPKGLVKQLKADGFEKIIIQPLFIIPGIKYSHVKIDDCIVGNPLLTETTDYDYLTEALELTEPKDNNAIVFMGHGTHHKADSFYKKIQLEFNKRYNRVFIATVEGSVQIEDIIQQLKNSNVKNVELIPFMMVAGDHALNDMISNDEDSWKTILENNDFTVSYKLKGLGEYKGIRELFYKSLERLVHEVQN